MRELRRLASWQNYNTPRDQLYQRQRDACRIVHARLKDTTRELAQEMGLDVTGFSSDGQPTYEVHSVRPARRVGPDGQMLADMVVEITQWRRGYFDANVQQQVDSGTLSPAPPADFPFRGGCTLLIDLDKGVVRYCIAKNIGSQERLERQRAYLGGQGDTSLRATYFGNLLRQEAKEPFALIHRMES